MIIAITPGTKYNRLTALCAADFDKWRNRLWKFQCDCGRVKVLRVYSVKRGLTKSCGCISAENPAHLIHGGRGTRLYNVWKGIRERCNTPGCSSFKNYGNRGIRICDEWNDYSKFHQWAMNNGYSSGLSIDRIDNNGNYCPENCKWATCREQANNTRVNSIVMEGDLKYTFSEFVRKYNTPYSVAHARLCRGVFPIECGKKYRRDKNYD